MGSQTRDRAKTTPAVMCIKIFLQIFNLIYLIIGASVLGIGVWIQVQLKTMMQLTELYYENAPWIMVAVGVLIILVALGGFCCTAKDKVALLYMYGVFITVLAILQIAAGIAGAVLSKTIDTELAKGLNHTIKDPKQRQAWDNVQQLLKCCGVESPDDWLNVPGVKKIPVSCYSGSPKPATKTTGGQTTTASTAGSTSEQMSTSANAPAATTPAATTTPTSAAASTTQAMVTSPSTEPTTTQEAETTTAGPNPSEQPEARRKRQATSTGTPATTVSDGRFPKGCHTQIKTEVQDYMSIIVGVCVGFVLLQVIGAVLACVLAKKTSKNNYEQIY